MIKRLLPKNVKQFLWFIFKSPQRKWHGYSTLLTDLKGYLYVLFKPKQYERITVCVGVKNRSYNLLNYVVESLNQAENKALINLSVYDCGSNDVDDLEAEITKKWKGLFAYCKVESDFARSKAFNKAVEMAESHLVLVCDADMSIPKDIVRKASKYCTKKSAWFPVVWFTNEDGSGRYYTESTGMFAAYKNAFKLTGGYDETIVTWGKEDWLLYFEFYKNDIACIRTREKEFIHHYHASLRPADYVNLF